MIDRRTALGIIIAATPAAACARPVRATVLRIFKSPTCGCCGAWVAHIKSSGIRAIVHEMEDVNPVATKIGVPDKLRSCHTAIIDGYFVEGHVPTADIRRLLRERPKVRGIAVPGMPIGSPGMEQGARKDAFNTLIVGRDGSVGVFARHNQTASR